MTDNELPLTVELHQTIIRADGTVEELGCVASTEDGTVQVHDAPGLLNKLRNSIRKED